MKVTIETNNLNDLREIGRMMASDRVADPVPCQEGQVEILPESISPRQLRSFLNHWIKVHLEDEIMTRAFVEDMFHHPVEIYIAKSSKMSSSSKRSGYAHYGQRSQQKEKYPLTDQEKEGLTEEEIFMKEYGLYTSFVTDKRWVEQFEEEYGRDPEIHNKTDKNII